MRVVSLLSAVVVASASVAIAWADAPAASTQPVALATTQPGNWVSFGEPMQLDDEYDLDAGTVLANAAKYDGKSIRLVGTVESVCKKKGCWLRMNSGGTPLTVFVKFTCPVKDRLIPMDAVGRPVKVEGTFSITEIDEAEARHQASDAGATKEEIAAIKGPTKILEMQGPSALVDLKPTK